MYKYITNLYSKGSKSNITLIREWVDDRRRPWEYSHPKRKLCTILKIPPNRWTWILLKLFIIGMIHVHNVIYVYICKANKSLCDCINMHKIWKLFTYFFLFCYGMRDLMWNEEWCEIFLRDIFMTSGIYLLYYCVDYNSRNYQF